MIEFDPDSSYYQILESVVHECLSAGYVVSFFDYTRFPNEVRRELKALGSDIESLEARSLFRIWDGYSTTLGTKSKEALWFESLKIQDLSLHFLKMTKDEQPIRNDIGFSDNGSVVLRYNDEKSFVDWYATRVIPRVKLHDRISFSAFALGLHSSHFYKSMEDLVDGIIEVRLVEAETRTYTRLRVRNFKKGRSDSSWRSVKFEGLHPEFASDTSSKTIEP
jgi:hypothetical protein